MLNFYYAAQTRLGLMPLEKDLQIPQGLTFDRRRLRQLYAARLRLEHPFWHFQQAHSHILLNAASENPSVLFF
jgi:hypothetical protein